MAELLAGFFHYFAHFFEHRREVVTVRTLEPVLRDDKARECGWHRSPHLWCVPAGGGRPLVPAPPRGDAACSVEDPFEVERNLAKTLNGVTQSLLVREFSVRRRRLAVPCGALSHPVYVFPGVRAQAAYSTLCEACLGKVAPTAVLDAILQPRHPEPGAE